MTLHPASRYLGGVLDFTGELNRYAIARATVRDKAAVQRCRDLVDAIMVSVGVVVRLCEPACRRGACGLSGTCS